MKRKADSELQRKSLKKRNKKNTILSARRFQLQEANDEEDRSIKRLEKLLKLKNKKKKLSLFKEDGLDYILSAIDKNDDERILSTSTVLPSKNTRTLKELMEEKGLKDESEKQAENSENEVGEKTKIEKPEIWEDIYGRLRDESGNVIKSSDTNSQLYVLPIKRNEILTQDEKKHEQLLRINRCLKGLLNRLSESNMKKIYNEIEKMYLKYSRNDMNETLFSLISELLYSPVLAPTITLDQAMLISLLHANIGSEVGAFFLQRIVEKLNSLFKFENYGKGKECNNLLLFLSYLYSFKVTNSKLVFDVFEILIKSFESKDIELIQLLLKNIGFVLRKDDPLELKKLIVSIQAKAVTFNHIQNDSRVKFMLDTLTAIKNNNIYKIPDYNTSIIERCKKLKNFIQKDSSVQELAISYNHLLNAEKKGRWWIVGSSWIGVHDESKSLKNKEKNDFALSKVPDKIFKLAKKVSLNSEIRLPIFCILMTVEDYMDAFEKLLKLNLKKKQKSEIIYVLLCCLLKEKKFNQYYVKLAAKFCEFSRLYRMSLQCSLWDKFKLLNKMKHHEVTNLSCFLSHMFISGHLSISVLKKIELKEMNDTLLSFLRHLLLSILLLKSKEKYIEIFKKTTPSHLIQLIHFMHLFLAGEQHELIDNTDDLNIEKRINHVKAILINSKNV